MIAQWEKTSANAWERKLGAIGRTYMFLRVFDNGVEFEWSMPFLKPTMRGYEDTLLQAQREADKALRELIHTLKLGA